MASEAPLALIAQSDDSDLLAMLATPTEWRGEMLQAASAELLKRGVDVAAELPAAEDAIKRAERERFQLQSSAALIDMLRQPARELSPPTRRAARDVLARRRIAVPAASARPRPPFDYKNYAAFLLGVFVLAGLLVFPAEFALLFKSRLYFQILPWSLAFCACFTVAIGANGRIFAFFLISLLYLACTPSALGVTVSPWFWPVLPFVVSTTGQACGELSSMLWRRWRVGAKIQPPGAC